MRDIETYGLMISDEHNPERLQKIIGYIDKSIHEAEGLINNLKLLRCIATNRIEKTNKEG